jgi:hypothetical protein
MDSKKYYCGTFPLRRKTDAIPTVVTRAYTLPSDFVVFAGGFFVGQREASVVHAQAGNPVPKAWGKLVGGVGPYILFEDSGGTIRLVDFTSSRIVSQIPRSAN